MRGESDGASMLALWRIIALKLRDGVRLGFKLKVDDFEAAEKTLLSAIDALK
jgi:hypothetical protein